MQAGAVPTHHPCGSVPISMRPIWKRLLTVVRRIVLWGDRNIPTGLRTVVGIPLVLGGLVGFLPILGFWMLPAGLALMALDIPPWRRRLLLWLDRRVPVEDAEAWRGNRPLG